MDQKHDNPARETFVASLLDPAWDRSHAAWPAARDAYIATRSLAALAAIPIAAGQAPVLWRIRALSVAARAACYGSSLASVQRLSALRHGLVARLDGPRFIDGRVEATRETIFDTIPGAPLPTVPDSVLQTQVDEWGGLWVDEIGDVIIHRADLPPSRFVRFPLPLPSALVG